MTQSVFEAGPHAFGDGTHATTAMVLAALEALDPHAFRPACALDMGAGAGMLSLAIAAHFSCPVIAVEIDRQAVDVLQENIARAAAAGAPGAAHITALHGNGFAHPTLATQAPFDLIVMNILAEPLLALAADAAAHVAPGGVLLISGVLVWQEAQIRAAYQSLGLELATRLHSGDWVALCWQKPD